MLQLGGVIASFTLGWIANTYSIATTWEVAGIVLGFSAIAYLLLARRLRTSPHAEIREEAGLKG
jgi:dipeptide/tripeptide permease